MLCRRRFCPCVATDHEIWVFFLATVVWLTISFQYLRSSAACIHCTVCSIVILSTAWCCVASVVFHVFIFLPHICRRHICPCEATDHEFGDFSFRQILFWSLVTNVSVTIPLHRLRSILTDNVIFPSTAWCLILSRPRMHCFRGHPRLHLPSSYPRTTLRVRWQPLSLQRCPKYDNLHRYTVFN